MPAGRPTNYRQTMGDEILALMEEGLSVSAAAGALGIHRQRVYDWEKKHPKFADTIKVARCKRLLFLERRLLDASDGPTVTSSIFALKNASPEEWRERHEVTGTDGGPIESTIIVEFVDSPAPQPPNDNTPAAQSVP